MYGRVIGNVITQGAQLHIYLHLSSVDGWFGSSDGIMNWQSNARLGV